MSLPQQREPRVLYLLVALGGIVLLWLLNFRVLQGDPERGTFGDMFGGLNALFSGLAFAVLVFTLLQQRAELSLQREELRLTRSELQGQKEQMRQQNETLLLQRFENTFFQMLHLHNDLIEAVDLRSSTANHTGRDCFSVFANRLQNEMSGNSENGKLRPDQLNTVYLNFSANHDREIGHYFRSLFNILKLIDRSSLDGDQKQFYARTVRAQLSSQEVYLLFFSGLSEIGRPKFKPLIERYTLLKHVDRRRVARTGAALEMYAQSAYES